MPFAQMGVLSSLVLTQLLETDTNIITHLLNEEMEAQRMYLSVPEVAL